MKITLYDALMASDPMTLSQVVPMVMDDEACRYVFDFMDKSTISINDMTRLALVPHEKTFLEWSMKEWSVEGIGQPEEVERAGYALRRKENLVKVSLVLLGKDGGTYICPARMIYSLETGKWMEEEPGKHSEEDQRAVNGPLPFLVTALALIAHCPVTITKVKPPGRMIHRGRVRGYATHSKITINIPIREACVYVKKAHTSAKKRRHMVREHFRIYHRGKPEEKMIRVHEHARGDASLGWVRQGYEVTHS